MGKRSPIMAASELARAPHMSLSATGVRSLQQNRPSLGGQL